jgi:hypothetical protein
VSVGSAAGIAPYRRRHLALQGEPSLVDSTLYEILISIHMPLD